MKLQNDVDLAIHRSWYNKSYVQEDGITHMIDTETQYPMYVVQLSKLYKDIDTDEDCVRALITDLQNTISQLERTLEKDKSKDDTEVER